MNKVVRESRHIWVGKLTRECAGRTNSRLFFQVVIANIAFCFNYSCAYSLKVIYSG